MDGTRPRGGSEGGTLDGGRRYPWWALLAWAGLFAAEAGLLAFVLDNEPGGVFVRLQRMAEWLGGGPRPDVVTYPMWGLALVLWAIPWVPAVLALQVVVGSVAAAALFLRVRPEVEGRVGRSVLALLFVGCLPWYVTLVKPYPQGFASAFVVVAILLAERAWRSARWRDALACGALFGLAQNFRSEFVLLPPFCLGAMLVLRYRQPGRVLRVLGVAAGVALLLQVPWALHYHRETGHYRLTESTGAAALYTALGNWRGNPWGIEFHDSYAKELIEDHHDFSWLSHEAGAIFQQRFREAIRDHPEALLRVWLHRLIGMLKTPFYTGMISLDPVQAKHLDVVREKFKLAVRAAPNERQIQEYQQEGIWDVQPSAPVLAAFGYQLLSQALFIPFFLATLAGLLRALWSGRMARQPLLGLLACPILFRLALGVLLSQRADYTNGVSLFCIPFILLAFGLMRAETPSYGPT